MLAEATMLGMRDLRILSVLPVRFFAMFARRWRIYRRVVGTRSRELVSGRLVHVSASVGTARHVLPAHYRFSASVSVSHRCPA